MRAAEGLRLIAKSHPAGGVERLGSETGWRLPGIADRLQEGGGQRPCVAWSVVPRLGSWQVRAHSGRFEASGDRSEVTAELGRFL